MAFFTFGTFFVLSLLMQGQKPHNQSPAFERARKMNSFAKQRKYWATAIRWSARIFGTALAAMVLTIAVGEGPPNPFTQPLPVAIELFGMLAMWIGCIIGWKRQGIAAVLIIAGIMTFHIIEKRLLLMGAFPLFDIAAILYLLAWLSGKNHKAGKI